MNTTTRYSSRSKAGTSSGRFGASCAFRAPISGAPATTPRPPAPGAFGRRARTFPGLLKAGTFYLVDSLDHKPTFMDVQHRENTIVVELVDEQYSRLIIEVADPEAVVALLNGLSTKGA
jgi:hypothetical protein